MGAAPDRAHRSATPTPYLGATLTPSPMGCAGPYPPAPRSAASSPHPRRVPGTGRSFEAAARRPSGAQCCPRWRPAGLHLKGPHRTFEPRVVLWLCPGPCWALRGSSPISPPTSPCAHEVLA